MNTVKMSKGNYRIVKSNGFMIRIEKSGKVWSISILNVYTMAMFVSRSFKTKKQALAYISKNDTQSFFEYKMKDMQAYPNLYK